MFHDTWATFITCYQRCYKDILNRNCKCWQGGTLWWRHNWPDGVSDHQRLVCLFNRLFRRRWKKTSKLRVTGLCAGNSPGTGKFPALMASNADNISIWWRYHEFILTITMAWLLFQYGWRQYPCVYIDAKQMANIIPTQGNYCVKLCITIIVAINELVASFSQPIRTNEDGFTLYWYHNNENEYFSGNCSGMIVLFFINHGLTGTRERNSCDYGDYNPAT